MRRLMLVVLGVLVALVPSPALAADDESEGFVLQVRRDAVVEPGTTVRLLIVVDADVRVAGEVETLVVVEGTAVITGRVTEQVTVVSGALDLRGGAVIHDATLVRSDLTRAATATVEGSISRTSAAWWTGWGIVIGLIFVLGMGVALLLAGVVFAAIGGGTLGRAVTAMSRRPAQTIASGLGAMIALPVLGIVAIVTVIGIPAGLGVLMFVIPALAFLGFIVGGTWIGSLLFRRELDGHVRPMREALVGLLVLLFVLLIPGIGWLSFVVLGTWGSGALVYVALHNMRHPGEPVGAPAPPGTPVLPTPPTPPAEPA